MRGHDESIWWKALRSICEKGVTGNVLMIILNDWLEKRVTYSFGKICGLEKQL